MVVVGCLSTDSIECLLGFGVGVDRTGLGDGMVPLISFWMLGSLSLYFSSFIACQGLLSGVDTSSLLATCVSRLARSSPNKGGPTRLTVLSVGFVGVEADVLVVGSGETADVVRDCLTLLAELDSSERL